MTKGDQPFEGTDYTRVKFVGTRYDTLVQDLKIGQELEFKVRGRVVGVGDEEMKDGHVGHQVKLKVDGVIPLSFEEPEDPAQSELVD